MESVAEEIARLQRVRNAVILAHNCTRGEVQDAADFTGDSLELARRAAEVDAARKAMVDAQNKYRDTLQAFIKDYYQKTDYS